jgi:tetratricopeptide (TPR) repeat protein
VIAFLFLLAADDPRFTDAARAQLEGKQEQAQQVYEQLQSGGLRNADVEYNLGTSYGEQGDLGRAVLHLRRADRLEPAADVHTNLQQLREKVVEQRQGARDASLLADMGDGLAHVPTELIAGAALIALALCWLLWVVRRGAAPLGMAIALVVVSALALTAHGLRFFFAHERPAAVIVTRAAAREGPDDRFRPLLDLLPGEEVRLSSRGEAAGFRALYLPSGAVAFVPKASVEKVEDWQ